MRIIFLGTRKLGYFGLKELIKQGHKILAIFTFDYDITEGYTSSDFKKIAEEIGCEFYCTPNITNAESIEIIKNLKPEAVISLYWKRLIPQEIIDLPKYGAFNIHFSLLPKYRGFAPLNWAILNDEKYAGVSLHYLHKDADKGDIVCQEKFNIDPGDYIGDLDDKAFEASLRIIKKCILLIEKGKADRTKQDECSALYSYARVPKDSIIEWSWPRKKIYNLIRASSKPYSGAYSYFKDKKVIVWRAEKVSIDGKHLGIPGQIIKNIKDDGSYILCGDMEILKITDIEIDNKIYKAGNFFKTIVGRLKTEIGVIDD